MKAVFAAIGFLTILPFRAFSSVSADEMKKSAGWFPLAGAVEGILLSALAYAGLKLFGVSITAALLIAAHALLTGGFHLDGLSDTLDAFAARADREKKLAIMRGHTAGPAGVSAIAITALLKYTLLLPVLVNPKYPIIISVMAIASRWVMTMAIFQGRTAREDGLGYFLLKNTGREALIATLTMIIATGIAFAFGTGFALPMAVAVCYLFMLWFMSLCGRHFGGMTGDTLGALAELAEVIYLGAVILFLRVTVLSHA
jgi:adenosylcobinamide-GDP ribazoletransferase